MDKTPPPTARHATDRMEAQRVRYNRTRPLVVDALTLLDRPGVPDDHNAVIDLRVEDLLPGDYLLGSRRQVVMMRGLHGDSQREVTITRGDPMDPCGWRTFRWGAHTTMRVTRRMEA